MRNCRSSRIMYLASRTAAFNLLVIAANGCLEFLPTAAQGRTEPDRPRRAIGRLTALQQAKTGQLAHDVGD